MSSPVPPSAAIGPVLSRRAVLRGSAALGLLTTVGGLGLVACGGDDDEVPTAYSGEGEDLDALVLVSMVAEGTVAAGAVARLPLGLGDSRGTLVKDAPESLTFTVRNAQSGTLVAEGLEVARHDAGLPRAYFPVELTVDEPGFYEATAEVDGSSVDAAFQVVAPDEVEIPRAGEAFPVVTTPTTADAAGVDPICTQEPPCSLHEVELTAVLGTEPVALLVSTPAFCQTAICGPVLDLFVAAREQFPEVTFIHAEVYASAEAVEADGLLASLAPAVEVLGLPFEPCLFLIAADGTLDRRIDVIYDEVELREGLTALRS